MNWSNGLSWWSTLKARRVERRLGEPDNADMGTALGLDASFGPTDEPPPRDAFPPQVPPTWEHRLTRRSSL